MTETIDALDQARTDMRYYEEWADNSPTVPAPELLLASAHAYAAIAQAEQLKRIADALETHAAKAEAEELDASWQAYQEQKRAHQAMLDRNQSL